jgi:hypothetical protein
MKNFEKIMIREMADDRLKFSRVTGLLKTDNGEYASYENALKAEIEWLEEEAEM